MQKINISYKIHSEYIKTLKSILLTPSTKKFTANTKRFYSLITHLSGINSYSKIFKLFFINSDIEQLIQRYGEQRLFNSNEYENIYNDFRKKWAFKLVKLLNIKTCPYCNRNYIVNFDQDKTTVELDHFYPKNKYPYLALNLYNLIPVCHICNHKKRENKLKIHPFKESFDKYIQFSFSIKHINFNKDDSVVIHQQYKKINRKSIKKINNYNNILNINKLYENHHDIVLEILKRKEMYPDSRIDELYHQFGGTLFSSKDELVGLINCNFLDKKDINKRPLSKLTRDISKQIGFI